jgi:hypothetical protein
MQIPQIKYLSVQVPQPYTTTRPIKQLSLHFYTDKHKVLTYILKRSDDDAALGITGFVDSVHRSAFYVTKKHDVSKTPSLMNHLEKLFSKRII